MNYSTRPIFKRRVLVVALGLASALLASCATRPAQQDVLASLKSSFVERGIASLDRLDQTELQRVCSESAVSGEPVPEKVRTALQAKLYNDLPYPTDGQYIGDYKEGEKIAQNGRGMQFSDAAGVPNGAN